MGDNQGIAEAIGVNGQRATELATESWNLIWQALGTDKSGLIVPLMEIGGFVAGISVLVAGFIWITNINEKTVEQVVYPFFVRCLIVIILLKAPYNISNVVVSMRDLINGTNAYVAKRIDQVTQYQRRMGELEKYNELQSAIINMRELCEAQKANKDNYYACMEEQGKKAKQMVEDFKKALGQRDKDGWDKLNPMDKTINGMYLSVFPKGASVADSPMWEECLARMRNDDRFSGAEQVLVKEILRALENESSNPPRKEAMPVWLKANEICSTRYSSQNSLVESAGAIVKAGHDFIANHLQTQVRDAIMFFTSAMHWAFQHAIEMTILMSAFISPLAVATTLAPLGSGSPLLLWATGFWSLAVAKLSLSIITAIAITVLYGASADSLIIGLLIGLLSPILAIALSAGGGVAMFNSIAMAGAMLVGLGNRVGSGAVGGGLNYARGFLSRKK